MEGEDDSDSMADLFSFGMDDSEVAAVSHAGNDRNDRNDPTAAAAVASIHTTAATTAKPAMERTHSDDSLLNMLEEQQGTISISSTAGGLGGMGDDNDDDQEAKEILEWLDTEDDAQEPPPASLGLTDVTSAGSTAPNATTSTAATSAPAPSPSIVADNATTGSLAAATIVELPAVGTPVFLTLEEALDSKESSLQQIRNLFRKAPNTLSEQLRPQLWCRFVFGKTLKDIQTSSLVDSFHQWQQKHTQHDDDSELTLWIRKEAQALQHRLQGRATVDDLIDLLFFHCQTASISTLNTSTDEQLQPPQPQPDPLIPPVACTILSSGVPTPVASVFLATIMPTFMPLLALDPQQERWNASLALHRAFYLLACYHLPLLVHHLDRYAPGWYYPKQTTSIEESSVTEMGRHLELHGVVPPSWFLSHFAGECNGTFLKPHWLLGLWDRIFTNTDNSLRFFLVLQILETQSDALLLQTGEHVRTQLIQILELQPTHVLHPGSDFAIQDESEDDESPNTNPDDWVQDWYSRATALYEATPESVISKLKAAEDTAVRLALQERQRVAEAKLQQRLQAQAQAHQEAAERKADEARERLTRARLIAYYRTHNPEKEGNIDKIMINYKGRYEVLDAKLKAKYGVGFNPALKPVRSNSHKKLMLKTGGSGRSLLKKKKTQDHEDVVESPPKAPDSLAVTVTVAPSEVLPVVCWTKGAAAARGANHQHRFARMSESGRLPLKFYLVDSRTEASAKEHGRFPTSASMSPEVFLDPDRLLTSEEMFESLRGSVHVVVMGEGFSALPELYHQTISPRMEELMQEDESRTNRCALFFVKRGFPFVSILEGGFAAAHAWLERQGPENHLDAASALVDYDEEISLFAQLETLYQEQQAFANAGAREKATRALGNLFDSSVSSLARSKYRLESLASDLETNEGRQKVRQTVSRFFSKSESSSTPTTLSRSNSGDDMPEATNHKTFRNAFAALRRKDEPATASSQDEPLPQSSTDAAASGKASESPATGKSISPAAAAFKNPFAGLATKPSDGGGASKASKTTTSKTGTEASGKASDSSAFKNPFAGLTTKPTEGGAASKPTKTGTAAAATAPKFPAAPTTATFRNMFGRKDKEAEDRPASPGRNPLSRLKQTATSVIGSSSTEESSGAAVAGDSSTNKTRTSATTTTTSRFSGLGAALNRNRFNSSSTPSSTSSLRGPMSNRLAGLNQLRKSTMARMSSGGEAESGAELTSGEETLAFFGDDSDESRDVSRLTGRPPTAAISKV